MTLRQTHTLSTLDISPSAYAEIRQIIEDLGRDYSHMLLDDGRIDMTGIALADEEARPL